MAQGTATGRRPLTDNPIILTALILGIVMGFATMLWFAARRETAALYGMVRSIEFPFINRLFPFAEYFRMENLRAGTTPEFAMLFLNSTVYGLIFTVLILGLLFVALMRLDRFSIKPEITIASKYGRTHHEVMEKLAKTEPSVQFFRDYQVLALPTYIGSARQPFKALEVLMYAGAVREVVLDHATGAPPRLEIDEARMQQWFVSRFGPLNPFLTMQNGKLTDVEQIEAAVDALSWETVLILYPAIRRVQAFYTESPKGFKSIRDEVDEFINDIWREINEWKKEFGDAITLGYATPEDRAERNAAYKEKLKAAQKERKNRSKGDEPDFEYEPYTDTRDVSELEKIFIAGQIARDPSRAPAMERSSSLGLVIEEPENDQNGGAKKKGKKKPGRAKPENLLIFGEVLEERGPHMKTVAKARAGLKKVLTRHLGAQAQHEDKYPVGEDDKTGQIIYRARINTQQEKAFNQQAQERLAVSASQIEKFLFRHQYEFGIVGGALEKTRKSGIMPPNLFRWMRFCEPKLPLWWFIHNLGMPSAVPENAALYEHYNLEVLTRSPVERPFIRAAIIGLKREAARYLTEETIEELARILGRGAVIDEAVRNRKIARMIHQQAKDALDFLNTDEIDYRPEPDASERSKSASVTEKSRRSAAPARARPAPVSNIDEMLGSVLASYGKKDKG